MERLPRSVFCCKVRIVKKSELFFSVLSVPVDWLMVVVAGVVTYFLRTRLFPLFGQFYLNSIYPLNATYY